MKYPIGYFKIHRWGRITIEDENITSFQNNSSEQAVIKKFKSRLPDEYQNLMNRLKRIEGQVRGIQNMLEKDAYCPDILMQVSAINAALNSFNKVLLANHIRTCVTDNIRQNNDEVINELVSVLQKLMK